MIKDAVYQDHPLSYVASRVWEFQALPGFWDEMDELADHPRWYFKHVSDIFCGRVPSRRMRCPCCSPLDFTFSPLGSECRHVQDYGLTDSLGGADTMYFTDKSYLCMYCGEYFETEMVAKDYLANLKKVECILHSVLHSIDNSNSSPGMYDEGERLQQCRIEIDSLINGLRNSQTARMEQVAERRKVAGALPVESLEVSVRTRNLLLGADIETISQLVSHTGDDLLALKHMNAACVEEVRRELTKTGHWLRDENTSVSHSVRGIIQDAVDRHVLLRDVVSRVWECQSLPGFWSEMDELADHPEPYFRRVSDIFRGHVPSRKMRCTGCPPLDPAFFFKGPECRQVQEIGDSDSLDITGTTLLCMYCGECFEPETVANDYLRKLEQGNRILEEVSAELENSDSEVVDLAQQLQLCRTIILSWKEELRSSFETRMEQSARRRRANGLVEIRLDLHRRARNVLEAAGIGTIGQLTSHTAQDLLELTNMNEAGVEEIRQQLAKIGLRLRGEG